MSFSFLFAMQTGITVGYNSSNYTPTQQITTNMPGFRIGGISQLPVSSLVLQSEYLLSSKGFVSQSVGDTRLSNLFLYLELPLSLKYEYLKNEKRHAYVLGGVYAQLKVIAINLVSEIDGIRTFDAGVHMGLGIGFQKIGIETRYEQSFINFDLIDPQKFNRTITVAMNIYFKEK